MALKGQLLVGTLNTVGRLTSRRSLDEILASHADKKGQYSFEKQMCFILEPHSAVFVPFGTLAFCFALHGDRPSKKTAEKVATRIKEKKKAETGLQYAHHVWVPCMGKSDCKADGKVVSFGRTLTSHRPCLT